MERTKNRHPVTVARFVFLIILLTLTACSPGSVALPTLIPLATVPPAEATAVAALTGTPLPPTFTPSANGVVGNQEAWESLPERGPATATPFIPSRTPRPTFTPTPTITPIPSATPLNISGGGNSGGGGSQWPQLPPSSQVGRSKLSVHVVRNNHANIMDFVRNARPVVVKSVDDLGFLLEVKQASPDTITVGRIDDIYAQNYIGEPEEQARKYVEKHLRTYGLNPGVDYWEGWNEPDPGMERMSWYARFEQERIKLMDQHGYRSAIGGFPPGVPEVEEFALFVPAIQTALQYGGIMTLHEGDVETGDMRYLYGVALPGFPYYADRGAMSFRYRWFYREILEPANLVIPLVVSELEFAGWHTTSIDNLIYNQLAWYDSEARVDSYMLGFNIFTAGANSQWSNYDLNGILPQLTNYVNSQG